MGIVLSEGEIYRAIGDNPSGHSIVSATKAGAKAQLKKVVEEQLEPCIIFQGNGVVELEIDETDWQALLKEVK